MLSLRLIFQSLILFAVSSRLTADPPPLLFPHGYFDSAKLKPFDAIYLNLMAQSNLEYGGITLDELDQLGRSRKILPRPPNLPRNREEDDPLLDGGPAPLDTDEIAPGPKNSDLSDREPSRPISSFISGISSGAREGVSSVKHSGPKPSAPSGFTLTALDSAASQAKGMEKIGQVTADTGRTETVKRPPSPFKFVRRLQRRVRRATDEENPFEEIVTRAPPMDYRQLQIARKIVRKIRYKKKKQRFLTRDDIYDPARKARERMTAEERRKLREELALMPESSEDLDDVSGHDVTVTPPKESISHRHLRRPQQAPTDEKFETDLRTTPVPHLPTLIPTNERAHRLPNNPFSKLDISQPTILHLPIPPGVDGEDFVE